MENIDFNKNFEEDSGAITAIEDGKEVGKLVFTHNEHELVVDHTEVNPDKRGENVGPRLVKEAFELSKQKNLDIRSNCSFARKVLQKIK